MHGLRLYLVPQPEPKGVKDASRRFLTHCVRVEALLYFPNHIDVSGQHATQMSGGWSID